MTPYQEATSWWAHCPSTKARGCLFEIIVQSLWRLSSESDERKRRESSRDLSGRSLVWAEKEKS